MSRRSHPWETDRPTGPSLADLEESFQALLPVLFGDRRESKDEIAAVEEIRRALAKAAHGIFCCWTLGTVDCDPNDAAQDWFLKIRAGKDSYRSSDPFHKYAYSTLRHACLDLIRRASLRQVTEIPFDASDLAPTPLQLAEKKDERRRVRRVLLALKQNGTMTREQRTAIACRYYLDMRSREAGKRNGISGSTIDVRLFHARQLVAKELRKRA